MSLFAPSFVRPNLYLSSVLDLQLAELKTLGIRALLLDVDCTLKDHGSKILNPGVKAWLDSMRAEGIQLCLLSNGKSRRIGAFAGELGLPFIARAFKPLPFGCRAAIRKLGVRPEQTAMVGDQIFADVMAGRLAGLYTVLVQPTHPAEPWFTRLKRPLERRVLTRLNYRPRPSSTCLSEADTADPAFMESPAT